MALLDLLEVFVGGHRLAADLGAAGWPLGLFAQNQAPNAAPGLMDVLRSQLPLILVIVGLYYFLMIRPESKNRTAHLEALKNLKKNDRVVTVGGVVGVVSQLKPSENLVTIRTAEDTRLEVTRASITQVLADPNAEKDKNDKGDKPAS